VVLPNTPPTLGPDKNQIVPRDTYNHLITPTSLVRDAHRVGLLVGPYTFRNENNFLPADLQRGSSPADYGDAIAEYKLFFTIGVDGLFTDNADTAITARTLWIEQGRPHMAALTWSMTTRCATPLRTREMYCLTREHSRPGPLITLPVFSFRGKCCRHRD
jgi:hypothetical protein